MTETERGPKAIRDRAVLVSSYEAMVKEFKPASRLSASEIARMPTWQLKIAARDLYNQQSVKSANRLARKLGVGPARVPPLWVARASLAWLTFKARLALLWDKVAGMGRV